MRARSIFLTALLLLISLTTASVSSLAQEPPLAAGISGTVYDSTGTTPLSGVQVIVRTFLGFNQIGSVFSQADGTYTIAVPNGSFALETFSTGHVTEYYNNGTRSFESDPVVVSGDVMTTGIDFTLTAYGRVSGFVFQPDGVNGLNNGQAGVTGITGNALRTADVNNGFYTITGITPGIYKVSASDFSNGQGWYGGQATQATATIITVREGETTSGINITVSRRGFITGRVTDSVSGTPIQGASVRAFLVNEGVESAQASTDMSGNYTLFLTHGASQYRVEIQRSGYVTEFWNNQGYANTATLIAVASGATVANIDVALARVQTISGTVSSPTGETVPGGMVVRLINSVTGVTQNDFLGAEGNYSFAAEPGTYWLRAEGIAYGMVWYDQQATQSQANTVTLTAGTNLTGVNFRFLPTGSLNGSVTVAGGGGGAEADSAMAAFYQPRAYQPGSPVYDVRALDFEGEFQAQHGESYGDYLTRELASGGALTDPISLIAPNLTSFGHVEGANPPAWVNSTLPTADGMVDPVSTAGGIVTAYLVDPRDTSIDPIYTYTTSIGAGGAFSFASLPAGYYRIKASASGYVTEYFNDAYAQFVAPMVRVNSGANSPLTMALDPAGTVTGRVFDSTGVNPRGNRAVYWLANNYDVTVRCTDGTGAYTLPDAPTNASFIVAVLGDIDCGGFEYQEYDQTWQNGAFLSFAPGTTTLNNINFNMQAGGQFAGRVFRSDGVTVVPGTQLGIYDTAGTLIATTPPTISDGVYRSPYLAPGTYRVRLLAGNTSGYRYPSEWYSDAASFDIATPITVASGTFTDRVDLITNPFTGSLSGSIRGRVILPGGALAPTEGDVNLYRREAGGDHTFVGALTIRGAEGWSYAFTGLMPGDYVVEAAVDGYLSRFYSDATVIADATVIPVASGAVLGIDIALQGGTLVSGTVFDLNSGMPWDYPVVTLYTPTGAYIGSAGTDHDGRWFVLLPPGTYTAYASAFPLGAFRFLGNGIALPGADTFTVTSGGTPVTGVNITTGRWGEVVGRVTGLDGTTPIPNRRISAHPASAWSFYSVCDTLNGYYGHAYPYIGFANLVYTGDTCRGNADPFIGEFWQNAGTSAGATLVTPTNASRVVSGITFTLASGDANDDGVIDIADFSILAASFGKAAGAPGFDAQADFNGDGVVNISDFSLLAISFGLAGLR